MSARSAFARKKATQTKNRDDSNHGRANSVNTTSSREGLFIDTSISPIDTNISPTQQHAFQLSRNAAPMMGSRGEWTTRGKPTAAGDWHRDAYMSHQSPSQTDDWVHSRSRTYTLPDELSTIEKSGLRTMIDKRSDDVRKSIARTFTFRKKEREEEPTRQGSISIRIQSSEETPQPGIISPDQDRGREAQSVAQIGPALAATASSTASQHPASPLPSPQTAWSIPPVGPPPTAKLPPIPQTAPAATPQIKCWVGGGRPVAKWNKLRKDPELWDPSGDVLIYLGRKGQHLPTLRLSSKIIEATKSRYLMTLLHDGSLGDYLPSPPSSTGESYGMKPGHGFQDVPLTPPASQRTSIGDMEGQVLYEIHLPPPQNIKSLDQLRHQITTRNFFAVLCDASLVGLSLHEALSDLHVRLDSYMPPNNDNVSQLVHYIFNRGLQDVRDSPSTAASLLAWADGPDVRWEAGWRECFTHCAGMYDGAQKYNDFQHITPVTRRLLQKASLEMQGRVQAAQMRLAGFNYQDVWMLARESSPQREAADMLREMLLEHFEDIYGSWPPSPLVQSSSRSGWSTGATESDTWLTRTLVMRLQKDFGALYDHLVDRDIVWDTTEAQPGRKLTMVSKTRNKAFDADAAGVQMAEMLLAFDSKYGFPPIPHPYPLLPGLGKDKMKETPSSLKRTLHRAHARTIDVDRLGNEFATNKLVEAFERFDKAQEMDQAMARQSHWVLLYGIMQSLASLSVDDERVQYSDQVEYHLSPRLERTRAPPWKREMGGCMGTGAHERSYCWAAEAKWEAAENSHVEEVVDASLLNNWPLPCNSAGVVGDMNTGLGGSLGAGFRVGSMDRIRGGRQNENESPVITDFLYT
ncbi:hypothetical protein F66182_5383 [Fusarium sp. NRRL 66182]|nr:hypothetical protein F66182_5383 [Fusarium sp. NRRL 66182]